MLGTAAAPSLLTPLPPSQVLLDGNFLHACVCLKCVWPPSPVRCDARQLTRRLAPLAFRLGDIREAVAKLLGTQVRVFVTKCVQAELHALGADYAGVLSISRVTAGAATRQALLAGTCALC